MALEHEENAIKLKQLDNVSSKDMRELAGSHTKDFKTCWIKLAMVLYGIWENKTYQYWGYEKFELYTMTELKINKSLANKIVKTYKFVEDNEPQLLNEQFLNDCPTEKLPDFDAVNLLRRAHSKKELTQEDYKSIRDKVIDECKPIAEVRKDLTTIIKERKQVDSNEERDKRNVKLVKNVTTTMRSFTKEAEVLKLIPADVLKKASDLALEIESFIH